MKKDASELLRKALSLPRWKPEVIAMSGITDAYQPVERHLKLTRGCLEVLAEFRNPVSIITKNQLVTRDIDILGKLARYDAASVMLSITTLDDQLRRCLEPRASHPEHRLKAIQTLSSAGIPVGVLVAPIIPGLNETEIPAIIKAAVQAGAQRAGYTHLRLPSGVAPSFEQWLEAHVPTKKAKVLNRVRAMRGGVGNSTRVNLASACEEREYLPSRSRLCSSCPVVRPDLPIHPQRSQRMPSDIRRGRS